MNVRPLLALLSVGCLFAFSERAAWAIAVPACTPASVLPRATTIPANLPAFAYTAPSATADNIHLTDNSAPATVQTLTLGPAQDGLLKAVPAPALVEGHRYTLDFDTLCDFSVTPSLGPIMFVAGPAAPLPSALGSAPVAPSAKVNDYGTSAFTLTTTTALDPSLKPWLGVYQVVVLVDGKALTTKLAQPDEGTLSLTATGWCDATLSSTNHHSIVVRGRLPFAPTVDSEATALDFSCPAPAIGTSGSDPATPPATVPGTEPTTSTSRVTSGGCNAVGGSHGATSTFALGALFSAALLVSRRRRGAAARRRT